MNVIKVRGVCVELRFSRRGLGRCDESEVMKYTGVIVVKSWLGLGRWDEGLVEKYVPLES